MKKSIVAMLLVLAMVIGLSACTLRKSDSERKDGEGSTEVQTVDPDAFNAMFGEDFTFSDEEASILAEKGINVEDFTNMIEENEEEVTLSITDGPISGKEKEIKVDLDENGNPISQKSEKNWKEIFNSGTFAMDITLQSEDGTVVPMTYTAKGNKFLVTTKLPVSETQSVKAKFLSDGKNFYMLIPAMKMYLNCGEGTMEEMLPNTDMLLEDSTYLSTTEVTFNGVTYLCEHYQTAEGTQMKYYYLNGDIKRLEISEDAGTDSSGNPIVATTIIEINSVSDKVNESDFKLPAGYIDMTALMGEDFDVSSLA